MKPDSHSKGFAFSVDVVFALILVSAVALFISLPNQRTSFLEERRVADQYVDDIFLAMDHSGYVSNEIDVNGYSASTLQNVYAHIRNLLPAQYDLYLQLTSYPVDVNACRNDQNFSSCFPDANRSGLTFGNVLPSAAPFVHGRRVFLKQQPSSQCTGGLSPFVGGGLFDWEKKPLAFQSNDANINFDVNIFPTGPLTCDQNITVTLQVTTASGTRKPVDMMIVFDRSGSMTWGGRLGTTDPQGIDVSGNYTFLADSTSGLRDINSQRPGLPTLAGTYNSPGGGIDVDVNGNYAHLADGSSGLRIVNITNKAAPSSTSQLDIGGTAYGVDSLDNITYVTTYDTTPYDVDTTTNNSPNQNLYIGRNSSQSSGAQSFTPGVDFISGFRVRLRKIGSPPDITARLRTSISGSDLNTVTIPASSVGTSASGNYLDVNFSGMISLTSGTTYFLVLTTAANNASNYYEWKARGSNPYSGGQAYQNSTSQTWDAYLRTYFVAGLITIDTSNKSSPRVIGAAALDDAYHVVVSGNYAYAANGANGFKIFDISAAQPSVVSTCYNSVGCNISSGTTYDVFPSGNYAYVSNGTQGLKIVDISNPVSPNLVGSYNTPGTAYTTRLKDINAVVADGSSLQVIDVSAPASPVAVDAFVTPYNYRDLEVSGNWAYVAVDSGIPGLMTIDLTTGPKLDQAKVSANTFIDFNGWNSTSDQMGLVSFSSSATLDQNLTSNFSSVRTSMNNLVGNGGTAIGDGINSATAHLNSSSHNPSALKFQILMSDGQTNSGADSSTAAITASNSNIIIYTIAFGEDADAVELQNIANLTGGQYYAATDQNTLSGVYQLIAQNIQVIAQDANILTNFSSGTTIVNDGNGTFSGGNLIFDINTLAPQPWIVSYTFNIPCTSSLACSSNLISVPGSSTQFQYLDSNGVPQVKDWNEFITTTFNYRDLNVDIQSGSIIGTNNVDLVVKVISNGTIDTNATSVNFYRGNPSPSTLVGNQSIPYLCGTQVPGCFASSYTFTQNIPAEGDLFAVVNPDNSVPECSNNNQDFIYCYTRPETQFFTLDYWAWIRG